LCGLARIASAETGESTPTQAPDAQDALLSACQQSAACKSHLDLATLLYKQDRYSMAIDEYQDAYILQPYPLILYNIARLHHKQNHLSEAITYYQRYLYTAHPAQAERAKQLLAAAQKELASQATKVERVSAPPVPPPSVPLSVPPAPVVRHEKKPLYKEGWFWSLIGVTVAGAATAIGIGIYASGPDVSGVPAKTLSFGM
jgi:tetratricopeptide (TPR) repeat protein